MRVLTEAVPFFTSGGTPPDLGIGQPPPDSDVLGPLRLRPTGSRSPPPSGPACSTTAYRLAQPEPRELTPHAGVPQRLTGTRHGCTVTCFLQLCAQPPDTIHHTIRDITKHTRGAMQLRWKIQGYNSPPRPSGTSRNLLGFKDGTANPLAPWQAAWSGSTAGEPGWARVLYQVVRLIRMLVEFWDRVSINGQEGMFGRRRDTGAPAGRQRPSSTPRTTGPTRTEDVIPLDAHIRLANPRTPATADQRIVRRSYNYDLRRRRERQHPGRPHLRRVPAGRAADSSNDPGAADRRAAHQLRPALRGGYFYALPGVARADDWYGRALLQLIRLRLPGHEHRRCSLHSAAAGCRRRRGRPSDASTTPGRASSRPLVRTRSASRSKSGAAADAALAAVRAAGAGQALRVVLVGRVRGHHITARRQHVHQGPHHAPRLVLDPG